MVFQCRVNPRILAAGIIARETLRAQTQIDTNFSNSELEWVLPADEPISLNDLICYGIMLRITDGDPADLTFMQMVGIFSQHQLLIVLYTIYRYIKKFCT
ncbi:unnamed protein product [Rotaria sp. Silwood2]|nr:unnamed protein product [Rotaria sp. Silwood2]CAF2747802.1 unnamed protein product [Rotaria sp. Silwood2]CAF3159503.1 unnamed protein product [Rotaria sp. Silwood2]CAF4137573.1 unnamed protein product [Rotaria sp. Silwood2]CAF4163897.1 unnamed protein product [Rotaria sp. Silwood2]